MIDEIAFNPCHDEICQTVHFRFRQFTPFGYVMPFFDASPAACGGGMLGGEYWMSTPRCLFAIIFRLGRTYPLTQHFMRMPIDGRFTFDPSVGTVFVGQHEMPNAANASAFQQSTVVHHRPSCLLSLGSGETAGTEENLDLSKQ